MDNVTSKPRDLGFYRMKVRANLSTEQRAILRRAGQGRVLERLAVLLGRGEIAASQAGAAYQAFKRAGLLDHDKDNESE
jgi:hypothetical protein